MRALQGLTSRFGVVGEVFAFFWRRRLWWMMPMLAVLIGLGLLIAFASVSPIAPFIYTLF